MPTTTQLKDPSRAERKLKKRRLEEAIPDLPGDVGKTLSPGVSSQTVESTKRRKLRKSFSREAKSLEDREYGTQNRNEGERKLRRALNESETEFDETVNSNGRALVSENRSKSRLVKLKSLHIDLNGETEYIAGNDPPIKDDSRAKKSKKERKAERKAAEAIQVAATNKPASPRIENESLIRGGELSSGKSIDNYRNEEEKRKIGVRSKSSVKPEGTGVRFIVFIGNLPFSATTESIRAHFVAVHPKSIRHLTKRDEPAKSKGCAFLEFEGYDNMKACLKSFHHSTFHDGISSPRKINVELTAGGGGNKPNRHAKISEKNQRLNGQRVRRIHEEEKTKLGKRDSAIDHSDVHPSRRARVLDIS